MTRLSAKKLRELESEMHTTEGYRQYIAWTMTEKVFQNHVTRLAAQLGWSLQYHTWIAINSKGGFPDLVLVNPLQGRLIFAELKTMSGTVSEQQQEWFDTLNACGQEAYIWRPDDLGEGLAIEDTLYRSLRP